MLSLTENSNTVSYSRSDWVSLSAMDSGVFCATPKTTCRVALNLLLIVVTAWLLLLAWLVLLMLSEVSIHPSIRSSLERILVRTNSSASSKDLLTPRLGGARICWLQSSEREIQLVHGCSRLQRSFRLRHGKQAFLCELNKSLSVITGGGRVPGAVSPWGGM